MPVIKVKIVVPVGDDSTVTWESGFSTLAQARSRLTALQAQMATSAAGSRLSCHRCFNEDTPRAGCVQDRVFEKQPAGTWLRTA